MQQEITTLFENPPAQYGADHLQLFASFKAALNAGQIRSAEPDASQRSGWKVNGWVKQGILLGFRMGKIVDQSIDAGPKCRFSTKTPTR